MATVDVSSTASAVESLVRESVAGIFRRDVPFTKLTAPHVLSHGWKASGSSAESKESAGESSQLALSSMSLQQLQAEKSSLKRRLRQYDAAFEAKYGRKPTKADKEPIRNLYQRYHDLKKAIEGWSSRSEGGGDEDPAAASMLADSVSPSTLRGLKREKRRLQVRLRDYEDRFMSEHGRKVKYHRDIAPVAAEYRRYKEIKNTLKISQ